MKSGNRNNEPRNTSLDADAGKYLKNGPILVEGLYNELKKKNAALDPADVTDLVRRFVEQGKIELRDAPPITGSLRQYLRIWDENLWLYISLGAALTALLVVWVIPMNSSLVVMRWIFGSAFVVFVPGYVATEAMFPGQVDLEAFTRFVLSIGLSLVLAMLIGLLLNFTPWGITMIPILASLMILTVGLALIALARKYAVSATQSHHGPSS